MHNNMGLQHLDTNLYDVVNNGFTGIRGGDSQVNVYGFTNNNSATIGGLQNLYAAPYTSNLPYYVQHGWYGKEPVAPKTGSGRALQNLATDLWNVQNNGFLAVKGGAAQTNVHGLTNGGSMTIGGLQNLATDLWKVKNVGFLAVKGGAAQTNVHGLTNGGSMTIGGL